MVWDIELSWFSWGMIVMGLCFLYHRCGAPLSFIPRGLRSDDVAEKPIEKRRRSHSVKKTSTRSRSPTFAIQSTTTPFAETNRKPKRVATAQRCQSVLLGASPSSPSVPTSTLPREASKRTSPLPLASMAAAASSASANPSPSSLSLSSSPTSSSSSSSSSDVSEASDAGSPTTSTSPSRTPTTLSARRRRRGTSSSTSSPSSSLFPSATSLPSSRSRHNTSTAHPDESLLERFWTPTKRFLSRPVTEQWQEITSSMFGNAPSSPNASSRHDSHARTSSPPSPLRSFKDAEKTMLTKFLAPTASIITPSPAIGMMPGLKARAIPKKILVLDLDETLIHSTSHGGRQHDAMIEVVFQQSSSLYYVYKRPHVDFFLNTVKEWYHLVVFTASMAEYADPVIDHLDRGQHLFQRRLFREDCCVRSGSYVKDLTRVGPDLRRMCLLDNSPISYANNQANGIPIDAWINDPADTSLLDILPFLDALRFVDDVRSVLSLRLLAGT